jgi:serine/threonine protein phosphatase PrpC
MQEESEEPKPETAEVTGTPDVAPANTPPEPAEPAPAASPPAPPSPPLESVPEENAPPTVPNIELPSIEPAVAETRAPVAEPASPEKRVDVIDVPALAQVRVEPGPEAPALPQVCPACGTLCRPEQRYCEDCGWLFPDRSSAAAAVSAATTPILSARGSDMPASTQARLRDRYELRQMLAERQGTQRFRGFDHGAGQSVVIVATLQAGPVAETAAVEAEEILPGFDEDVPIAAVVSADGPATLPWPSGPAWPSAAWEKQVLERANHPALPRVVDAFTEGDTDYVVEQLPIGRSLWDAWDEADDAATRYGWARQVAEALQALHRAGAIIEGIRPDVVVIDDSGQVAIADLSDLLPIPMPPSPPLRASLYTAPELILAPETADARADLYSFGAMLYSLEYLHHTPEEKDFERQFVPKQITDRYPDVHPLLLRLINKTFVRDVNTRFPTDEAGRSDPTGFTELIRTLEVCRRTFDCVRLDISSWTTTGMVRTGNEDAFALLHAVESRQDELHEYAVLLLCDGMGGYEAGEVAAALAMSKMREFVLQQPMFAALAGKPPPANPPDIKALQDVLSAALRHANREVYTAARTPGKGRRGMGCTAECVYIDNRNVVVGHVGDSRTYHLRRGRLVQMTRDQTFVNRMVELGQLSAAEAEHHPRKNELQQAIGGQPDVVPGVSAGKLQRGDWVLVCSDGLTNHVAGAELEKMLTREAAYSAEEAARRLLNLTNLRGATDNATIVVVRAS